MKSKQDIYYKLTDKDGRTYGGCQWGPGVTNKAPGKGELCTNGWIHLYTDPLLAVLLNSIHGNFKPDEMLLWTATAKGRIKSDHGLKVGAQVVTILEQIPLPEITLEQKIRFAILCAKSVYEEKKFNKWADDWLSGKDRTASAAGAARAASAARAPASAAWAARAASAAASAAGKDIDLIMLAHQAVEGAEG